ncbi:TPA: EpsG family protein [Vibrio parahaemolyticus]|uniref:EpsG family protein n=5 Tax=Vibrio parahaemolyticus TaxID=670 RepID=UPI0015DEF946|nr:EpsG family protein [Vibrio parahaemolyticus]MCX8799702.1 EpsG family protein [Vibrio parahaemolyticus]MDF4870407.1 EpsG family protein [Vibrio parahaemolyticus]
MSSAFALLGIIVTAMSNEHFAVRGDDFTTYYNNYLEIYNGHYSDAIFQFSGGIEVGVPLLNLFIYSIVGEPLPYVFKLFHIVFILSLLVFVCLKIVKYYNLKARDFFFILGLSLIFFKLNYVFLIMRQGYASLFIVLAIFSLGKFKYVFLAIACTFHLSSIVIYPLSLFVIKNKSSKKLKLFILTSMLVSAFILVNVKIFTSINFNNVIMTKLTYALSGMLDSGMMSQSIITNIKGLLFFLVPFTVLFVRRKLDKSFYPFLAMTIFVMSTSYLPSLSFRVTMPIYALLTGFLYFNYLGRTKLCLGLVFPILVFSLFNSTYFSKLNYERYTMFDMKPFYFIPSLFEDRAFKIDRFSLPKVSNKENENKL